MIGSAEPESLHIVYAITLIVGLGIGLQWIASRFRFPALLLLLLVGLSLGPGFHVLDPDALFGDLLGPFVQIAVAIVLFEGGLSLRFHEAKLAGPALQRLILVGLCAGSVMTAVAGVTLADLSPATAAVLGAILVVTGPTVILPMLRREKIAIRPASLLKWEGIVNDPLGALLAVFVFQVALFQPDPQSSVFSLVGLLLLKSLAAGAIGAIVGWVLGNALRKDRLAETLHSPVMLAGVLVTYAAAETLGAENGLLAVTVMGLVLANLEDPHLEDIRHFKEQVSVLLVSVLFLVLSARLDRETIGAVVGTPLLLVAAVVFVVRPLVGLLASLGTELPWRERALIGWIAPRGVVAAAVAGAFAPRLTAEGYDDANLLVPTVFGVIFVTVVLHGLTLGPLARALGLGSKSGTGILIVGAKVWSLALAKALEKAGVWVAIADTRYHRVSRARRAGMFAVFGDVLSEETVIGIPFERVSWLLAATDDDAYNALVCSNFGRDLGRDKVLQLTPPVDRGRRDDRHAMMGRTPWGENGTYRALARGFWRHDDFKVTTITEEFGWDALRERNPGATFLFAVEQGRVAPIDPDKPPPTGAQIIYLQ